MIYLINTKTGGKRPINSIADLNKILKCDFTKDGLKLVTSEKILEALDQFEKTEALQD